MIILNISFFNFVCESHIICTYLIQFVLIWPFPWWYILVSLFQSDEYQWNSQHGDPHAPRLQRPLSRPSSDEGRAGLLPVSLQHMERGACQTLDAKTLVMQTVGWRFALCLQIAERQLQTSLVIEDDLRFEVFFKRRLMNLMSEVKAEGLDWDLMWVFLQIF